MLFFSRRKRIINKAVEKTVSAFAGRTPKIYQPFIFIGNNQTETYKIS